MTTIFLVRHAAHDRLGKVLTGRMPGVSLGAEGRRQSERLAERLSREEIAAVHASPLERAQETARPVAERIGVELQAHDAVNEIDFGEWSGKNFDALRGDPHWDAWNNQRAVTRPPSGETMLEVQSRAVGHMERLARDYPKSGAVVVSHGDVIKAVIAFYLGLAVDGIQRFEVSPASVSTLVVGTWGAKLLSLNAVVTA